jgi:hypothetical protein
VKITIKITHDEYKEPLQVTTRLSGIVNWERQFAKRAGDLASGFSMQDLAYLAWVSIQKTKPNFDKWLEGLDDLEVIDTSPSHPTDGAPTDGN